MATLKCTPICQNVPTLKAKEIVGNICNKYEKGNLTL